MEILEIARKLAALGQTEEACRAYEVTLHQSGGQNPEIELEAAVYLLRAGGDYKVAYTWFHQLYAAGHFREECLDIMTQAFYEPNVKLLKSRYEKNCKRLGRYAYLFRKDFLPFDQLPLRFYPFDDQSYLPLDTRTWEFTGHTAPKHPVISRNFFKDLEAPILAEDVYSQYELEYLYDNVRKSEWVGRENHIYLHYTDWGEFCSWLQVLDLRTVLDDKKIVFLMEDERSLYPIDFKERFGIDYSQYPVKPFGIREINRLIWHTQLSSHNGGDFFNEIFDGHPNLLAMASIMFDDVVEIIEEYHQLFRRFQSEEAVLAATSEWSRPDLARELYQLKGARTDKDMLVLAYLLDKRCTKSLDPSARVVPAIFFQPHFPNILYEIHADEKDRAVLTSEQYEEIRTSALFKGFKYIKSFTPMRRFTTSHGATVKFTYNGLRREAETGYQFYLPDIITQRVLNRSFMIDPQDRLYQDSVLVRFEDGKLNPRATFTALAAFLDLPYTESLDTCSQWGEPIKYRLIADGFDPAPVYRTYDEFMNDSERYFIEYFLRDAYAYYGYDFQVYDGKPVDEERLTELIASFHTGDELIAKTMRFFYASGKISDQDGHEITNEMAEQAREAMVRAHLDQMRQNRLEQGLLLLRGLRFINVHGQPLRMMPKLELDPALLEQPLYH